MTRPQPEGEVSFQGVLSGCSTGQESLVIEIEDANPNLVGFSLDGEELMVAQRASGGVLVLNRQPGPTHASSCPTEQFSIGLENRC